MRDSSDKGADGSRYFIVGVRSFLLCSYRAGEVSKRWKATCISPNGKALLSPSGGDDGPRLCVKRLKVMDCL